MLFDNGACLHATVHLSAQVSSAVATQKLWKEPKKVVEKYAAGESEEGEAGKVRGGGDSNLPKV